jgi:hypothetical protein
MKGRPTSQDNKFVALTNDIFDNKKIFKLIEQHRSDGFMFYTKMLCFINKNSHFIFWDDDCRMSFAKDMHVDIAIIDPFLETCIELDLFSKEIFEKHNVITGLTIQKFWLKFNKRRKELVMHKDILLLDIKSIAELKIPGFKILNKKGSELQSFAKAKHVANIKAEKRKKFDKRYINAFLKTNWDDRPQSFKETHSKVIYTSYKNLYSLIRLSYPDIMESDCQISFEAYSEMIKQMRLSEAEIIILLKQICDSTTIMHDTNIELLLKQKYNHILNRPNS